MWRALHLQDGGLPCCSVELMFVRCSKSCEAEAGDVRLSRVSIIVFPLKCVSSVRSRPALFTGDFWVCRAKKASSTSQSHHVVDGFPSCVTHPWEQISITLFFVITQEGKNHQLFKKIGQPVSFEQLGFLVFMASCDEDEHTSVCQTQTYLLWQNESDYNVRWAFLVVPDKFVKICILYYVLVQKRPAVNDLQTP